MVNGELREQHRLPIHLMQLGVWLEAEPFVKKGFIYGSRLVFP
jgi:hypothetical protein